MQNLDNDSSPVKGLVLLNSPVYFAPPCILHMVVAFDALHSVMDQRTVRVFRVLIFIRAYHDLHMKD